MNDPITLYNSGLSIRQTAAAMGMGTKKLARILREAGAVRTKSEGCVLRHNPAAPRTHDPGDCLVLRLPKAGKTIISHYTKSL